MLQTQNTCYNLFWHFSGSSTFDSCCWTISMDGCSMMEISEAWHEPLLSRLWTHAEAVDAWWAHATMGRHGNSFMMDTSLSIHSSPSATMMTQSQSMRNFNEVNKQQTLTAKTPRKWKSLASIRKALMPSSKRWVFVDYLWHCRGHSGYGLSQWEMTLQCKCQGAVQN